MPIYFQDVIDLLAQLCEEKDVKVTIKSSLQGGLAAGICAFLGGLLMGGVGLPVGGAIGGLAGNYLSGSSFKPLAIVIRDMAPAKKQALYDRVKTAISRVEPADLINLSIVIAASGSYREIALREVINFAQRELSLSVVQ